MDILNRAVAFACDFKQHSIDGKTYIKNYGKAGGAPAYMMCGDGTTTTTFPTPLAKFGATFDGGDYINTGVVDRYDLKNQYSLYFYGNETIPNSPYSTLISNWNITIGRGTALLGGALVNLQVWTAVAPQYSYHRTATAMQKEVASYVGCWNGGSASTASIYKNSKKIDNVTIYNGANLSGTMLSNLNFLIGAAYSGGGNATSYHLRGNIYAAGIFDGILQPREIQILDSYVRANIR
jgi:hypothetical protein